MKNSEQNMKMNNQASRNNKEFEEVEITSPTKSCSLQQIKQFYTMIETEDVIEVFRIFIDIKENLTGLDKKL